MSGVRNTQTAQIFGVLTRSGQQAYIANHTPNDAWVAYMQSVVTGAPGNTRTLEQEWLKTRITALGGAVPSAGTTSDLWRVYLQVKGFTGDVVDMFNQWLQGGTV